MELNRPEEQIDEVPTPLAANSSARSSQIANSSASRPRLHSPYPTSSNIGENTTAMPKPTRRKSKVMSNTSSQEDSSDHSDDSKKRKRPSAHRRRSSYRPRNASNVIHNETGTDANRDDEVVEEETRDDEDEISFNDSDREYTLKDRQEAINITHPFGLPLWKPALYKKSRSVIRNANSALHSTPSSELYLYPGNIIWALVFGWWLAIISFIVSIFLLLTPFGGWRYARVLRELSYYIFWPFGKYVEQITEEWVYDDANRYMDANGAYEDNIGLTNENHPNNNETGSNPLLRRRTNFSNSENQTSQNDQKQRPFASYFGNIGFAAPLYIIVSALCWFMVVFIPMAKLTYVVTRHLRKRPLSLHFKSGSSLSFSTSQRSVILLCTYKAIGWQYYKYTYDGINIIFINLMPLVFFTIFDSNVLEKIIPDRFIVQPLTIFALGLASVIPLSYFIGMAVASISAQSSAGMGAVINATFGSIIEIILYSIALIREEGLIAEGSIIGSLMAGVLLMPGISMVSGAFKRKEQKFNAKSAGVTSTMLIMAIIGALTPTLFYQIYGSFDMICEPCVGKSSCQSCHFEQPNPIDDSFYPTRIKPLMYFCAVILFLSYIIGLWFTLRTHAALLWQPIHHTTFVETADSINRSNSIYRRIIPLHMLQSLIPHHSSVPPPYVPPSYPANTTINQNSALHNPVGGNLRPQSAPGPIIHIGPSHDENIRISDVAAAAAAANFEAQNQPSLRHAYEEEEEPGGHDSPNWSKLKSCIVLLSCTALYSFIAEILVDTVDKLLEDGSLDIDPKFLGLTLFALIPNVTEFMNAMAFALQGNIALSMEIGSAYALQVCLLQIPALVLFSAFYKIKEGHKPNPQNTFSLVFPRWDVFAVVFSVFLLTYTYIEGKSNYFKGSILILSYLVLMAGFYWAPLASTI
ncbi:5516_t:CDS:2 [Ambispora gerdemannii]|uniref:5516_t:CDS:1 n=1 Tax=Ambispora gerdemannii TaxID=144530 RepID=A0A9N9A3U4_9GLOM|nr:5516_t:CDS:2 [Ambispora gerdemannii]